jgi:hypothetical protein
MIHLSLTKFFILMSNLAVSLQLASSLLNI